MAPTTQRLFYTDVLFLRTLPELAALRVRELEAMNLMVQGLGPRACVAAKVATRPRP